MIAAIVWLSTRGRDWDRLTPDERREVRDLAVKSRGKRASLTGAEEDRLAALFLKIRRGPDDTGGAVGASS